MEVESEEIDIKLSDEDSPADILRESEDISLFAEDHGTGETSEVPADSKPGDVLSDLEDDEEDSEEDDLQLGMDEIGDLVDEIKLDDQEEEKADASADGEEDMVFEEAEGQVGDSVESALDELGEEESTENSAEDASAVEDGSEESQENSAAAESEKDNDEEIVAESDDSENLEASEESESSPDAEADASEGDEQTEEESGSSDVMDMLHDPEVAEDSDESESAESEDLDLGMEELDDTVDEETTDIELEDADSDPPEVEESEIEDLEDLTESEGVTAQLNEESSDEPEEMSEQTSAAESGVQDAPEIENVGSVMPQATDTPEETVASLGSKMLLSLHHEAVVEIARTTLTGEEITQITYGSIIELDKAAGEPVDLVLDGKTIARGEIVQINNDKLGIRIVGIVQD